MDGVPLVRAYPFVLIQVYFNVIKYFVRNLITPSTGTLRDLAAPGSLDATSSIKASSGVFTDSIVYFNSEYGH